MQWLVRVRGTAYLDPWTHKTAEVETTAETESVPTVILGCFQSVLNKLLIRGWNQDPMTVEMSLTLRTKQPQDAPSEC